ncbi:MAG: enoyl-CoA hydratase-related protein, partial [Afipia sp.]
MTAQTSRAPLQASSPLLRENVGSIAVLTLDSPKTRNALSEAMIAALHEAIVSIREEKSVRAVVIAAQGPAYSSGHDLKE